MLRRSPLALPPSLSAPAPLAPHRRGVLAGLGALALAGRARAEQTLDLSWDDLVPAVGQGESYRRLSELGVVQHGEMSSAFAQETAAAVTRDYDGKRVRLPGFVVPLDYDGVGTTAFLLVPFVGACIHVPPPPPNQIVFVTSAVPYELQDMFEPVIVTGIFGASAAETQLADVGYSLSADLVEPYR